MKTSSNEEGRNRRGKEQYSGEKGSHSEGRQRGRDEDGLVKSQVAKEISTIISAPFVLDKRKHSQKLGTDK